MRMEMDEALDLARRRRAARAVFGPGFGVRDGGDDDKELGARRAEAEDGRGGFEAKSSSPDRSKPGAQDPAAGPDRQAAAKIPTETGRGSPPPPPLESKQAMDHKQQQQQQQHDHRGDQTAAAAPRGAKQEILSAEEGGVGGIGVDGCRGRPGQARQQEEAHVAEIFSGMVPETTPPRAEQKRSSEGEEEKAGLSGREEVAKDIGGGGEKEVVLGPCGGSPNDMVDSGADHDVAEGGGDGEIRSKIDLGVTDGWFQKFEAKMGAIKKQVRVCYDCSVFQRKDR